MEALENAVIQVFTLHEPGLAPGGKVDWLYSISSSIALHSWAEYVKHFIVFVYFKDHNSRGLSSSN